MTPFVRQKCKKTRAHGYELFVQISLVYHLLKGAVRENLMSYTSSDNEEDK